MKQKVIAIVGGKKVGKTTTVESLIAEFSKRGYTVAAIKHISEENWTIDTPGKDTWRFAQKGAKAIVVLAPNEITTIERGTTQQVSIKKLIKKARGNDIVLTEGLKSSVAKKTSIPKIVVVTNQQEAEKALGYYKPILAFSGPYNAEKLNPTIPYANALTEPNRLADIAEKFIKD